MTYNGSKLETFLTDVSSPEGISIDWVSRAIFWTDSAKETVEVAHLDTRIRKVLISDGLKNPRGIAVHPYRGYRLNSVSVSFSETNFYCLTFDFLTEKSSGPIGTVPRQRSSGPTKTALVERFICRAETS